MTNTTTDTTEAVEILAGRIHRARRLTGVGMTLACSGRTIRYGRYDVIPATMETAHLTNLLCRKCHPVTTSEENAR